MTECSFPEVNVLDFLTKVEANKSPGVHIAYFGTFEITPYCNFRCAHCYVANCRVSEPVLNYQEVCRIIDDIVAEGCLWLLITGGEPLLRNDFADIWTYAKKKGMFITLFTNASLVTPKIAKLLHDLPPHLVEVSIYGGTPETSDKITGVKGSLGKSINGVKLLLEQGIKVNLKTMAMTSNVHELDEMRKLATSLGVKFRFDPILNPALDGSRLPCESRLSPEEVLRLDIEDPERAKEWVSTFQKLDRSPSSRDTIYVCGVGKGRFHIDPFGKLQLCTIARKPEYDLRTRSFHDGWSSFLLGAAGQKAERPSECQTCRERNICPICPGWNIMEYNNIDCQPVEYLCKIAHLRSEYFDPVKKA